MKYIELLQKLEQLTPEQLQQDVTLHDVCDDEYWVGRALAFVQHDDVLDKGHPYISFRPIK